MSAAKKNQKVAGVDLALVDEKVLNAALKEVNLLKVNTSVETRVKTLAGFYEGNYEDQDIFICDKCGGPSVEEDDVCPFCGDDAEVSTEDAAAAEAALKKAKADKAKAAKKAKKPAPSKAKKPAPSKALAHKGEVVNDLAKMSVKDLDDNVLEIQKAKQSTARCAYDLGTVIQKNYEGDLWKLRPSEDSTDEKFKPRYTNFKQFCKEELGMSHVWAYNLMDIAAAFTRDQFAEIGTSKLTLALKAPPAHREEILQAAKSGETKSDLEERINKLKGEKAAGNKAPDPTPAAKRTVSVPIKLGRKTLKMQARAKSKTDTVKMAKKFSEQPWVALDLGNGVKQLIRIQQNAAKEIQLVVEFRRDKG